MTGTEIFDVIFHELGPQGEPGKNGITPHIGENGNWFIGEEDTGKSSKGERGEDGESITIASIDESFEDGGVNIVTFSDGKILTIKNGKAGDRGEKGDTGEGFSVYKTYGSVEEMENDALNAPEGSFVLITSDVEEEDNAKLYAKSADGFVFLTDMSGAQGITGPQGPAGYSPIKGKDYFDGKDGTNATITGASATVDNNTGTPSVSVELSGTESERTFNFAFKNIKGEAGKDGQDGYTPVKGVDYFDGQPGKDGQDGKDGTSVTVSSVSESTSDGGENVVTFSDGKTITVKNGSKGNKGDKGDKGDTGSTGPAGYTPVRGTDYWTPEDKTAMVNDVLSALPTWSGGAY